jgi:transcriptional regulator with XRE-family HTH domain
MLTKKNLYKTPEFWTEEIQNEIYRQVNDFMKENKLNQNELAKKWGVSKGYISQILNGNCNFSVSKLVELSLSLDKFPIFNYLKPNTFYEVEKLSEYIQSKIEEPLIFTYKKDKTTMLRKDHKPLVKEISNKNPLAILKDELQAA